MGSFETKGISFVAKTTTQTDVSGTSHCDIPNYDKLFSWIIIIMTLIFLIDGKVIDS